MGNGAGHLHRKKQSASFEACPAYLKLGLNELRRRRDELVKRLRSCDLCPRVCSAKRDADKKGTCGGGRLAKVSSYNLHFGEEPCLVGSGGSGTIFFAGCSLKCLFCQNYPISQLKHGNEVTAEELARMMLELQREGAENINFVTPTHFSAQILEALVIAVEKGLRLPIVWNTGGYEELSVLQLLDGIVDIYLPDMKYSDEELAVSLSEADGYVEKNRSAIKEMWRQVGKLQTDSRGVATRGLLIRHLVLPGFMQNTEGVLKFVASLGSGVAMSVMAQYFPAYKAPEHNIINRRLTLEEWRKVERMVEAYGISEGYLQRHS